MLSIKHLTALHKASYRKKVQQFIIEGKKNILLAWQAGYCLHSVYYCADAVSEGLSDLVDLPELHPQHPVHSVPVFHAISPHHWEKISYGNTERCLAVAKTPQPVQNHAKPLNNLNKSFRLLIDGVEKPGNIGAVLRTADAVGAKEVYVTGSYTDIFNPNVIRNSMGAVFTVPWQLLTHEEAYALCQAKGLQIVIATPEAHDTYFAIDYTPSTLLVMGNEHQGVSPFWKEHAQHKVRIPMEGKINSLNVSNACAVIAYEAYRQLGSQ